MSVTKPRALFAITVYNGGHVVPACLRSVKSMKVRKTQTDVLVLDDASPQPGYSEEIRRLCDELGFNYYCSPRNLGIPRNVNLGLLYAIEKEYDYVVIANSDILVSSNLIDNMVAVAMTDPTIGSVTAWSNNVSIYSLPCNGSEEYLADQKVVNWLSESLYGEFGLGAVDIPAGISFCILIPTSVLREVGLMDPVYGRGYCEEIDWSLRSKSVGYRSIIAPSCFVYHRGNASTAEAGVLPTGHTTVPENEAIIDLRYPLFRSQVAGFINSEILDILHNNARGKY